MFKLYLSLFLAIFFIGCSNHTPRVLFQSVSKDKAILVQSGKNKEFCSRCGMKLAKYYKTSHSATYKGKKYQYCSLHCLEDHLGDGIRLKNPKVVDVKSLKFISVMDAYYVVGSSKKGTMSKVSKYAFKNKKDAKEFQKKYGGKIMTFSQAREKAQNDFKYYR